MPRRSANWGHLGTEAQPREREWRLAELARRQYGVVSRAQLIELGMGADAIKYRVRTARLHRIHLGVYALGHRALPWEGRWMAAVLASGPDAVLSHRSAVHLWRLREPDRRPVEVTIPRKTGSIEAIRRHCCRLRPDEMTTRRGVPVTGVSRTLFDFAAQAARWEFERALREAEFLRLPQRPSLEEVLRRYPRHRGARLVRETLEGLERLSKGKTRTPLEDRFLRFLRRVSLPAPETNVPMQFDDAAYVADCMWRDTRLVVELDGHEAHGTRSAFESDRERDRHMQVEGWTVIRVTSRQLDRPKSLAHDLRRLLGLAHESAL